MFGAVISLLAPTYPSAKIAWDLLAHLDLFDFDLETYVFVLFYAPLACHQARVFLYNAIDQIGLQHYALHRYRYPYHLLKIETKWAITLSIPDLFNRAELLLIPGIAQIKFDQIGHLIFDAIHNAMVEFGFFLMTGFTDTDYSRPRTLMCPIGNHRFPRNRALLPPHLLAILEPPPPPPMPEIIVIDADDDSDED